MHGILRTLLAAFACTCVTAGATPFAVTARSTTEIGIIDVGINLTVAIVPRNGTAGRAVGFGSGFFYVVSDPGSLSVIDATDYQVVATIALPGRTSGLALNPAGTRLYAGHFQLNTVSVIDTTTNAVIASVNVGVSPVHAAVNPAGTEVYVVNSNGSSVSVIETAGNTLTYTIGVGGGPNAVAISPDGTRAYVANFVGDTISVIDTASKIVVATWASCDGPSNLAVAADGASLYVSCGESVTAAAIVHNTTTGATGASVAFPVGRGFPVQADPGGGRVYFAGRGAFHATDTALVVQQSTGTIANAASANNQFISTRPDDTVPQAYSFAAQSGTATSTAITSAPAFITKINTRTTISVAGAGAYCVSSTNACACDVTAFGTAAGTILPNQYVCLRHTSAAALNTQTDSTVTIGGVAATFSSTTLAATTPGAPAITSAVAGNGQATIAFTAPASDGGAAITQYTATCTPGPFSGTSATVAPITVTGLANGTGYLCSVTATNSVGTGPASAAMAVTPSFNSFTGPSATGTGIIAASFTGGGAACSFSLPRYIGEPPGVPPIPPTRPLGGVTFPHGLFDFSATGCTPGATLSFSIRYPSVLPANTRYWKYGPTASDATPHWYVLPATVNGDTVTFTITDGGLGDDDLAANGTIVDQGGPGSIVVPVPTLGEWARLLLVLLLLASGGWAFARRPR